MERFHRQVLFFLLILPLSCFGQKENWLPLTDQDKAISLVPGSPGADAIQLYYADYIDDTEQNEFFYKRIKILTDNGRKYADVEIEVPPEGSVTNLKARTIKPDGTIVEFTGRPFQKTIIKARGFKFTAKTFTMPEVTPGSIIEYKYRVQWPGLIFENFWVIQHDLYTLREDFRMQPYQGEIEDFPNGYQTSAIYARMPHGLVPQRKGAVYELQAHDIPAFESEGYMPPENDFKPTVRFFYISSGANDAAKFWEDQGKRWQSDVERFIGNHKEVAEAARAAADESDPEKKLRRLYASAQKLRNLSYERERDEQELKKERLKINQSVADVLSRGYGSRNDITRTLVALARAAGFSSSVVRVSNRQERLFDRNIPSRSQLQDEVAAVNAGGKDYYLDPGTPFCPFGLLRWRYTSSTGLKLEKRMTDFTTVPAAGPDKAIVRRSGRLALDPNGSLKGQLVVHYTGEDALELRLDALTTDETGRRDSLKEDVRSILPQGANLKVTDVKGWDAAEDPLVATFDIEVPNFASAAGKRLLVPSYLLQPKQRDAFKHSERKYPVYFPYAFAEFDNVTISLPEGFSVETIPSKQDVDIGYARYQNISQSNGSSLNQQRALYLNGIIFGTNRYSELKDFFNRVQAGDEQQAVLQGGSVRAQK